LKRTIIKRIKIGEKYFKVNKLSGLFINSEIDDYKENNVKVFIKIDCDNDKIIDSFVLNETDLFSLLTINDEFEMYYLNKGKVRIPIIIFNWTKQISKIYFDTNKFRQSFKQFDKVDIERQVNEKIKQLYY
jgi:hypothetical protein